MSVNAILQQLPPKAVLRLQVFLRSGIAVKILNIPQIVPRGPRKERSGPASHKFHARRSL